MPASDGPVTLINRFVVAPGRDEVFLGIWNQTCAFFRSQPGFISLRMHRSLSPDAEFRYVNVAVWESVELFERAHRAEEFRALVGQPAMREFRAVPQLYEVHVELTGP
jgi:heme-degrading monooxygenase HmoA